MTDDLKQDGVDLVGLRYTMLALERTLGELQVAVQDLPEHMAKTYVRLDVYTEQQGSLQAIVKGHTSTLEWAGRAVIGAIIVGLIAALLFQSGGIGA